MSPDVTDDQVKQMISEADPTSLTKEQVEIITDRIMTKRAHDSEYLKWWESPLSFLAGVVDMRRHYGVDFESTQYGNEA